MLCRAPKTWAKRATRSVNAMKRGRKYAGSSRFAEQFAASPGAWTATKGAGSSEEAPSAWTASPASQMPFRVAVVGDEAVRPSPAQVPPRRRTYPWQR